MGEEGEKVRVLIADDHPLVVGGLRAAVLAATPGAEIAVAYDFDSMASALEGSPETDLVLLDLTMPGVRGFSGLLFLRSERPSTPVIVVSGNEDRAVIRHCLEFGAAGFIPKSTALDTMRDAIMQVLDGGRWTPPDSDPNTQPNKESSALARQLASLTPQQIRVLMMLSQGLLNKQIAYELSVSEATVKAHVSAILQKLGVESRTQGSHSRDQDRVGPGTVDRALTEVSAGSLRSRESMNFGTEKPRRSAFTSVLTVVDQFTNYGRIGEGRGSPSTPYSFSAILRRMRRMILPERVFGRPGANWIRSSEAIGPISLRTQATSSFRSSSLGSTPAITVT